MEISILIGKYIHNNEISDFQKMKFSSIDEAITTIEFLKLGYNSFSKDKTSMIVRLDEASKPFLLNYYSVLPIKEIREDLEKKYGKSENKEDEIEFKITDKQEKKSLNSNFKFEEKDTTGYAKTTTGKILPFQLFRPEDTGRGSNVLQQQTNPDQKDDFALIERRFTENNSLDFLGKEKIENANDVAWLFSSLEDETVEHAFMVYHFQDKGYFVQHISTGNINSSIIDNRLLIGNILEAQPTSVTLVHNHPSGVLRTSRGDIQMQQNLKQALKFSEITVNNAIIINLRSGKYLEFDDEEIKLVNEKYPQNSDLKKIQPYSFSKQVLVENYQPQQLRTNMDTAAYLAAQKFGISDKTEMLILNIHNHITGKFILPNNNRDNFILQKVSKYGGTGCILYGNNISQQEVNYYNEKLKYSQIVILDAYLLKSENGEKNWNQLDVEIMNEISKEVKEPMRNLLNENTSDRYSTNFRGGNFTFYDRNQLDNQNDYKAIASYNLSENKINIYEKDLPQDAKEYVIKKSAEIQKTKEHQIIGGKIKDIAAESIRNPDSLTKYDQDTQNVINLYNQKSNFMENQKEFDQVQYLKDQMKYLGFGEGEKLHKDLELGISSIEKEFQIKTTSDKTLPGNTVDFKLNFKKTEQGGVFLNSYNADLKNSSGEILSQKFNIKKDENFTAKEAINLLEGRSVKIEFVNPKTDQKESSFVQLNFNEKSKNDNYLFQSFHQNYGVDTGKILEQSGIIFDKPEFKDSTIKNLEKGNIVKVKFEANDNVVEGKAILNPQYKNLSLYDNDMNRINTNKPLQGLENESKQEKNNIREQSISRGI